MSHGEQRVLASFLAGRLPAGQLHHELSRARENALSAALACQAPPAPGAEPVAAPVPAPALHAA